MGWFSDWMGSDKRRERATRLPGYWEATRQPLYCLIFLLPLVATYEFGALLLRPTAAPEQHLVAQSVIQHLVALLGTDAFWVPGVALIVTLLVWHAFTRNAWELRGWVPLAMIGESLLLTMPLFVLNRLLLQAGDGATSDMRVDIILSLGAGIYEELVFRFFLISGLGFLLVDVFGAPRHWALGITVGVASLLFAGAHFAPVGSIHFEWPLFLMFLASGAYLAAVFLARGLGISTGCHVAYNVLVHFAAWG